MSLCFTTLHHTTKALLCIFFFLMSNDSLLHPPLLCRKEIILQFSIPYSLQPSNKKRVVPTKQFHWQSIYAHTRQNCKKPWMHTICLTCRVALTEVVRTHPSRLSAKQYALRALCMFSIPIMHAAGSIRGFLTPPPTISLWFEGIGNKRAHRVGGSGYANTKKRKSQVTAGLKAGTVGKNQTKKE